MHDVRLFHAFAEDPFDRSNRIQIRIVYPSGVPGSTPAERTSGIISVDGSQAPLPIVLFLNPVNVGPEYYHWLAVECARAGWAFVSFSWLQVVRGIVAQTPGPDTADQPAAVVSILLDALEHLQTESGPLNGAFDFTRVAVGGHSAGGTVALHAADHRCDARVRAVFAVAAHTASPAGYGTAPAGAIVAFRVDVPVLLLAGSHDGVIDNSRFRYNIAPGEKWDPVGRTFVEAMSGPAYDRCAYAVVDGANHFSFGRPHDDPTVGRPFLDFAAQRNPNALRATYLELIQSFLEQHVRAVGVSKTPFATVLERARMNGSITAQ